jgi:ATP-dependent DNA helicase RecQ
MTELQKILKEYWGYDSFRPLQEDIMQSVLKGDDTLALMPTGGGKSLCYQVPAMSKPGMCLVISPLIALMKDQVENLRKKKITAYSIFSGMTRKEVEYTLKTVINSNCKFLYVSPERLETSLFKEYLPGMHVNLIAVDEAHCISQWGYDFRPPYLRIAALRDELHDIPVLALTASATEEVQRDICEKLNFNSNIIFRQPFHRPNLSYSAFNVDSRITKIVEILKKVGGSGIVYCKSRRRTKEISELLQGQNISADFYHAGLTQEERSRKQEEWINNKTRIIVCTNAFGMGIDKPEVRSVIHADVPDSLENYYQEAGRAGRDGKTSYAVLLYDEPALKELNEQVNQRFPSITTIRDVYQAVANYLQIPLGAGDGQYHDFDMADFVKKFKLDTQSVLYSLKALEQDGWWSFNEQVFLPSTVQFTTNKEGLYRFEQERPEHDGLVKAMLRAYEGIFDRAVFISEILFAQLVKKDAEEVKKELTTLATFGIIEYVPRKDSPQLLLLRSRCKKEELTINIPAYKLRKQKFESRINEMIRYTRETEACRSQLIGNYFGDKSIPACGVCDNCLRKKSGTLSKAEFESIHSRIIRAAGEKSLAVKELLLTLHDIKKEKAWKVIEFLQAENKIEIDEKNRVRIK